MKKCTATTVREEKMTQTNTPEPKKKKSFWDGFIKFLSMGGFLLLIVVGVVIAVVISSLIGC